MDTNIVFTELTARNVADAFYTGEQESELRRIGKEDVVFKVDRDRKIHTEMVEACRREVIYSHPESACSAGCKERGKMHVCLVNSIILPNIIFATFICRLWPLWVTDCVWELAFPHCLYCVEVCYDHAYM